MKLIKLEKLEEELSAGKKIRLSNPLNSIFHQLKLIILPLLKLRPKKTILNLLIEHPSESKKLSLKIQLF